ncbi:MAG: FN3 associated domain-containing protein, partial [Planctomycetota bacterium]|nr:FN3 associated domain-containing protein [Planctomycetota bacterium]
MTSVSIRCETDKAEIYYTLNETEPTENSKQYTRVPVQVRSAETLKAKAFRRGYLPSPTAVWPAKVTPETAPATSEPAQPNNQD